MDMRKINALISYEASFGNKPPFFKMYVTYARIPLTAARFVLLAALLPDIDPQLAEKALGLGGDKPPFWHNPPREVKEKLKDVVVLDPFAGGGSIPLEAARLGAHAIALEYNPVQWLALKTIQLARDRGRELIDLRAWEALKRKHRRGFGADMEAICKSGETEKAGPLLREGCRIALELERELSRYYPPRDGRRISHYIWAKQVKCPKCGAWVPLIYDSCLDVKRKIYWKPVYNGSDYEVVIKRGDDRVMTISRGEARCPRCNAPISNEYIRSNMGHNDRLVVVVTEDKKFYPATDTDRRAYEETPEPERLTELIAPNGPRNVMPPLYGYKTFGDLFNKRQHFYLNKLVEELRQLEPDIRTILSWLVAKQADYNSCLVSWDRNKIAVIHTLAYRALRISWDYVEVNPFAKGSGSLWGALFNVIDGFAFLTHVLDGAGLFEPVFGSALNLPFSDKSIKYVVTDPPYFDIISYPESYDFMYVWLKRVVGDLYPEQFSFWTLWRDRSAEDISVGGSRTEKHFEMLLKKAFKEIRRVLTDDGLFVVFYAHTKKEAWIPLARALIDAGFACDIVIPLSVQSTTDIQGHDKNSMTITTVLFARPTSATVRTDLAHICKQVESEVAELARAGITGVDLFVVSYAVAVKNATRAPLDTHKIHVLLNCTEKVATKMAMKKSAKQKQGLEVWLHDTTNA